jgi:hypothetical protein
MNKVHANDPWVEQLSGGRVALIRKLDASIVSFVGFTPYS